MENHPTRKFILAIIRIIISTVIAVALVKFAFFPNQQLKEPLHGQGNFVLPTVMPARGDIKNDSHFDAVVLRDEAKTIKSTAEGEIVHFFVADGASVEQGAPLLQIKTTTIVEAAAPVQSIGDDGDPQIVQQQSVEQTSYNDVLAPAGGTVNFDAMLKQHVTFNDSLGSIVPATFHANVSVTPDQLYALQSIPSEAEVMIANGPAPFMCTNLRTTSTPIVGQPAEGGNQSPSPQLVCDIPADQTVFDGIKATLNIAGEEVSDALLLPVTAVEGRFREGKVYLPTENPGDEPTAVVVKLGINDGRMVVITEGLDEDSEVLEFVPRKPDDEHNGEDLKMGY